MAFFFLLLLYLFQFQHNYDKHIKFKTNFHFHKTAAKHLPSSHWIIPNVLNWDASQWSARLVLIVVMFTVKIMPNALTGISMYPFNYNRKRKERDQTKQSIKLNRSRKRNKKKKRKKDRTWRWMGRQLVKFCVVFVCYELHSRTSKLVSTYRVNSLALGFLAGFTHSKNFCITLAKLTHTKFILLCQKHKEELSFAHTHTHTLTGLYSYILSRTNHHHHPSPTEPSGLTDWNTPANFILSKSFLTS